MADIGNSLATLLGGNYVNLFDLYGRSYQVIPQVPRDQRLSVATACSAMSERSCSSQCAAATRCHVMFSGLAERAKLPSAS